MESSHPKDMSLDTLSKFIIELQQTTKGKMKLNILFLYRERPTTKTTSKTVKVDKGK